MEKLQDLGSFFAHNEDARVEYETVCDRRNRRNAVIFLYILIASQVIVGIGRLVGNLGFPFYNLGVIGGSVCLLLLMRLESIVRRIRILTIGLFMLWAATFPMFIVRLGGYDSPTYPVYILIIIYILAFFYLSFGQYMLLYVSIFISNVGIAFVQSDLDWNNFVYRQVVMLLVIGVASVASYLQVRARIRDFHNQYQLRQQKKMLEEAYRKLEAAELQIVQQEKMASLGRMTSGIAHEINNPLGFIRGNIEMMEEDLKEIAGRIDPEEVEDLTKSIEGCAHGVSRIQTIVEALKHFARLDEAERKEFKVADCLESAIAMLSIPADVSIERDYDEGISADGFPALMGQLFYALLENALQAMEGRPDCRLRLAVGRDANKIRVAVKDTGGGIPDDVRSKIFDPFFTTKDVGKGKGLGLSMAYGIAEQHGGSIKIVKSDADGTEMLVEFIGN